MNRIKTFSPSTGSIQTVQFRRIDVKEAALVARRFLCPNSKKFSHHVRLALGLTLALSFASVVPSLNAAPAPAKPRAQSTPDSEDSGGCKLDSARGDIQHVIYIQFDNVHFRRDNPNVPSDLEQMPHLLSFLTNNGTLLSNHHTPLISHTADDIITSLTGVYGDRHGQPVANSFAYFKNDGTTAFRSSFEYWTDVVDGADDPTYFMITADGKNAPAPWVPWTRAGCNVGAFSTANIEFENVNGDLKNVFASDPNLNSYLAEPFNQRVADFEGIAIHCAKGSELCSTANHGESDLLPQEPGGYTGFKALYGNKFVAPVISPGKVLTDLDGQPIEDNNTPPNLGFPGFTPTASQSLAYVAAMQEHGVPVTYAYIADAHENHSGDWAFPPASCVTDPVQGDLGPGDVCYRDELVSYDEAFGKFFDRLAHDGITKDNTLFVITSDENDHYSGGAPFNQGCDGVNVPCVYTMGNTSVLGEIDANLTGLLASEGNITTPFSIHFDMAPTVYLTGNLSSTDPATRAFERATATLTALDPITNNPNTPLTVALADPVEMKLLHMITGDPRRTPTFTMFGNADYFFLTPPFGAPPCPPCVLQDSSFVWNHGGIQPEIVRTWLALVGPGVKNNGIDDSVWSDHTDIRPTMLVLAGLQDDYQDEGRALVEDIQPWALPAGVSGSGNNFVELAAAFKQINAPVADLGRTSLRISTRALAGSDSTYTNLENKLSGVTSTRDLLAGQMLELLEKAEFKGVAISGADAQVLVNEAQQLRNYVHELGDN